MTKADLGFIIARSIALLLAYYTLSNALILMQPMVYQDGTWLVPLAQLLVLCSFLYGMWTFARTIGKAIAGTDADTPVSGLSPDAYLNVMLVIVGIWTLFTGLINLVLLIAFEMMREFSWEGFLNRGLHPLLKLCFGAWLIFGAERIKDWLVATRSRIAATRPMKD